MKIPKVDYSRISKYYDKVRIAEIDAWISRIMESGSIESFCEDCKKPCVSMCPVNALKEPSQNSPYEINKFACCQYLNTRLTCSIYLKVCPIGSQCIR